tara:strand:+ start:2886 stop:4115 length:1230 start_codon:yes stop_codon:yes gene_type:complete
MQKKNISKDLDILDIIAVIIKEKLKIVLITLFFLILGSIYQLNQKPQMLKTTVITEIQPISTFEEFRYLDYNSFYKNFFTLNHYSKNQFDLYENLSIELNNKFKTIDKDFLLDLFIAKFNERSFLIDIIQNSNLLKSENYSDDKDFEEASLKLLSSIKLLPPIYDNGRKINVSNWKIQFETSKVETWKNTLNDIEKRINLEVQKYLTDYFNDLIKDEIKYKQFLIEDIDLRISSVIGIYEEKMRNKVAHLEEQAKLARLLNIKSSSSNLITNTMVYTLNNKNYINDEVFTAAIPYYMRGYEVIEKEIELINSRKTRELYVEKMPELKQEKKLLLSDKNILRLKEKFFTTPIIMDKNNFTAAEILVRSSKSKYSSNSSKQMPIIALSLIFGFILSVIFVLMQTSYKNRYK